MRPALRIEGMTKRFGSLTAVSALSLHIRAGEIYAYLGPNGAGKTTTLRAVAGLLRPEEGTVHIAGHRVRPDGLSFRRVLGYVPDRPYLYEKLTGWEHLQFVAGARRLKEWEDRALALLQRLGLDGWKDRLIEGYSHGMRQKLSLTSALIHEPAMLLVDEPMVGLDPRSSRTVRDLFRELASSAMGILLSTHSLDVAQELAHRIGILQHGSLVAEGTFRELQGLAREEGPLEEVFFKLTEEAHPSPGEPAGEVP